MTFTLLKRAKPWDVVVIGSGATGGWAALQLGRRGLSVLVLEAGPDAIDAPSRQSALRLRAKQFVDGALGQRKIQSRIPNYWSWIRICSSSTRSTRIELRRARISTGSERAP